jgi:hypothetical protein
MNIGMTSKKLSLLEGYMKGRDYVESFFLRADTGTRCLHGTVPGMRVGILAD